MVEEIEEVFANMAVLCLGLDLSVRQQQPSVKVVSMELVDVHDLGYVVAFLKLLQVHILLQQNEPVPRISLYPNVHISLEYRLFKNQFMVKDRVKERSYLASQEECPSHYNMVRFLQYLVDLV